MWCTSKVLIYFFLGVLSSIVVISLSEDLRFLLRRVKMDNELVVEDKSLVFVDVIWGKSKSHCELA